VGDPAALEIVVDVLSSDAVAVRPGARVELDRWGGAHLLRGRVRLVEPSAFTRISALGVEEQRVDVVIELVEPRARWAALGDGYRVEARIVDWEAPDVLRAPASAVFRRGAGWAAFRVEQGVARLRGLGLGRRNGLEVEVLRGLAAGDRLVAHPSDRVVDGADVVARAP
jgi:HlyD family secretion protein